LAAIRLRLRVRLSSKSAIRPHPFLTELFMSIAFFNTEYLRSTDRTLIGATDNGARMSLRHEAGLIEAEFDG
jgi:hypothetical protein